MYGKLRFVFRADHRYYARNGYYDFPTRRWGERLRNALWALAFLIPGFRKAFDRRMKRNMIRGMQPKATAQVPLPTTGGSPQLPASASS